MTEKAPRRAVIGGEISVVSDIIIKISLFDMVVVICQHRIVSRRGESLFQYLKISGVSEAIDSSGIFRFSFCRNPSEIKFSYMSILEKIIPVTVVLFQIGTVFSGTVDDQSGVSYQ